MSQLLSFDFGRVYKSIFVLSAVGAIAGALYPSISFAANFPDLIIDPTFAEVRNIGGSDKIVVHVKNISTSASAGPSQPWFCVNSTVCPGPGQLLPPAQQTPSLAPGEYAETYHSYLLARSGDLTICADAKTAVVESDETNNCLTMPKAQLVALKATAGAVPAAPQWSASSPNSFTIGDTYTFQVDPVQGSDNYGFQFAQDQNADGIIGYSEGLIGNASAYVYDSSGRLVISPTHSLYNAIKSGALNVYAWASKNQSTSGVTLKQITINTGSDISGSGIPPIVITTNPSISNVAITGGSCVVGSSCTVTWTSTGGVGSTVNVLLYNPANQSSDFIGTVTNNGSFTWTIRASTVPTDYMVTVYKNSTIGAYTPTFAITAAVAQPVFSVKSPNGGEQLEQGKTYSVTWNPVGSSTDDVNAVLTDVGGTQVKGVGGTIVLTKNTGSAQWTVPTGLPVGSYKFYIQNITTSAEDYSDGSFSVIVPVIIPPIVTNPDLMGGNITFTPASPVAGNTLTFTGTVKVSGANAGPTKARFCIDNPGCSTSMVGQVGNDISVAALSSGATSPAFISSGSWTAIPGAHTAYLCADVGGVVTESNESNNCVFAPMTISAAPTITVNSVNRPTGEPTCASGNPCTISWTSSGTSAKVNLYYAPAGQGFTAIVGGVSNNGSFTWSVPKTITLGSYTVRVEDASQTSIFGDSAQLSIVAPPASLEIVTAQALASWQIDSARVPFSITINNKGFLPVQGIGIQSWVEQGAVRTQNTGWTPQCPSQTFGTVPVGQCVSGAGQSTSLVTFPGQPILGLGAAVWVIQLTDGNGTSLVTKTFPITIVPPPSLTLTAPIPADVVNGWTIGHISKHTISWKSVGGVSQNVAIVLKKGGGTVGTVLSPAANKDGSNTYQWTLDQSFFTVENGFQPGTGYSIKIFDTKDSSVSTESTPFSIFEEPIGMSLDMVTIAKQDQIMELENSVVSYGITLTNKGVRTVSGLTVAAHIEQTINGITAQGTLTEIPIECVGVASGISPHDAPCTSTATGQRVSATSASGTLQSGQANIVVELKQGATVIAKKSASVTLIPAPGITVQIPNGGEQWQMGGQFDAVSNKVNPYSIKWSTVGRVGTVDIKLKQVASGRCTINCDVNGDSKSDAKDAQLIAEFNKYDLNGDDRVDRADLDILWNVVIGNIACPTGKNCDVTGNNDVGNDDLFTLMDYFRALYDANGDSKINEADKVLLLNAILGLTTCNVNKICDYNMDGSSPDNGDLFTLMDFIDNSEYTLSGYRYDLNGDGKVTSADRDLVAAIAARTAICPDFSQIGSASKKCDIDGDGVVAGNDATTITAYLDRLGINQLHEGIIKSNIKNTNGGNYSKSAPNKYDWSVMDSFVAPGDNYKIEVYDSVNNDIIDESNGPFSITVPAPTIISPKKDQVFTIDNNLKIVVDATHPMLLTKYRIKIFQESKTFAGLDPNSLEAKIAGPANRTLLYESDPKLLDNLKFTFDRALLRKFDKKPLIELLREGNLTISVEGALPNGGFTPAASVTVNLKFDRTAPTIKNPKNAEEVNLGANPIHIVATHKSNPTSYKVSLYQNSILKYANDMVLAGVTSLDFNIDANTAFQGKRVFDTLDKGEALLVVQGALFDGFTDEARRIFKVIPVPPSYDLNDDKKIDSQDLAILQSSIIYDAAYRKAIDEGRPIPQYPSLATPCIQSVNAQGQSDPLGSPKKDCNFNKDFVTTSGFSRGMKVIDSRDAALLVAQPGYVSGTSAPTLSTNGAPVIVSPAAGTTWSVGAPQDVVIQPIAGATGYLVGFIRNVSLLFENYQNQKNLGTLNVSPNRVYKVGLVVNADGSSSIDSSFNKLFTAGSMNIYVRALVNNQWTEASVVSITIQ